MLPTLQVGPLALQVPGLVLIIGLWLGLSLAERSAHRFDILADALYNLVFLALISGIVGARLVFAAQYPSAFLENPTSLFSLNPGLLDPVGGAASALLAGLIYAQKKKMHTMSLLDALTPVLAVMLVASHLADLASGNAYGLPTQYPWGIELYGALRHPSQIYEAFASLVILTILWPGRQKAGSTAGIYFLRLIMLSAASRLFFEAFRADSTLAAGGFRSAQVGAWIILAASLFGYGLLQRKANKRFLHQIPNPGGDV